MKISCGRIGFVIAAAFFIFLPYSYACALVVSPAIKKLYVKPGEQTVMLVSIANETDAQTTLYPVVENFKPKDTAGTPEFLGDTDQEGAARWIQMPFKKTTLAPRERKDFLFKINVPQWAPPGGHYAALFWTTHLPKNKENVGSVSRVGSLFLFAVAGKISGTAVMEDARIIKNKQGAVEGFQFNVSNQSMVHVVPRGTISIFDLFGRKVGELTINASERNVLAQSRRVFVDIWKSSYRSWGKLRAHIRVDFGFGFLPAEKTIIFYNLPRFAGVKIILAVIFIIYIARRVNKRKWLKKEHGLIMDSDV